MFECLSIQKLSNLRDRAIVEERGCVRRTSRSAAECEEALNHSKRASTCDAAATIARLLALEVRADATMPANSKLSVLRDRNGPLFEPVCEA